MKLLSVLVLVLIVLAGCDATPKPAGNGSGGGEAPPTVPVDAHGDDTAPVDIGDVEAGIRVEVKVAEESEGPNITTDYLIDARQILNMATANVYLPHPEKLLLEMKTISKRSFEDSPVVFRAKVFVGEGKNKREIDEFSGVFGAKAAFTNIAHTLDLMEHLDEIPESLLLIVQFDLLLMPKGTAEEGLDPDQLPGEASDSSMNVSNPVRINFIDETRE